MAFAYFFLRKNMGTRGENKITTEEKISNAFVELSLSNPIEKITIQEIADRAGVIRPTFYNHFEDKYDLLRWVVKKDMIVPVMPLFESGFFQEGLVVMFSNAQKQKAFYIQASKLEGVISFDKIVTDLIREIILEFILKRVDEKAVIRDWFTPFDLADYYAQSMTFVAMRWIRTGMLLDPLEVAAVYKAIINNSLEDMVEHFVEYAEYEKNRGYIKLT